MKWEHSNFRRRKLGCNRFLQAPERQDAVPEEEPKVASTELSKSCEDDRTELSLVADGNSSSNVRIGKVVLAAKLNAVKL